MGTETKHWQHLPPHNFFSPLETSYSTCTGIINTRHAKQTETAIRSHKRHTPTITKFPQHTTRLHFTQQSQIYQKLPLHPRNQNNDLTTLTTLHGRCLLPVATGKQHHNMQDRPPLDQPHSDPTWNPGSILLRRSMAQSTRLAFSTRCL